MSDYQRLFGVYALCGIINMRFSPRRSELGVFAYLLANGDGGAGAGGDFVLVNVDGY